ncbi:unnamed protein product [Absidia cylindrospora]
MQLKKQDSTALGLVVPQQHSPPESSLDDQLSPASPEGRANRQQQQDSNNEHFDPRAQWQRMINKLSFNGTDDSSSHRPHFQPPSSVQHKSKQASNSISDNDSYSDNGDHRPIEYSSMMEPQFRKQKRLQDNDDATLPTPQELKMQQRQQQKPTTT